MNGDMGVWEKPCGFVRGRKNDDLCGKSIDFQGIESLNGLGGERNSSRSAWNGIRPVCRSEWLESPTAKQTLTKDS
jgi:hypothetical protein